jgi:thiamine-phosphate pyrophosphorylase
VLRIIDANANRASEGLRVVEEFVRFVLDDGHLTELCKWLRHDLAAALKPLAASDLCAARDTCGDIGTSVATEDEYQRADPLDVALASQKRVEQSLRCIEEYSKTLAPGVASAVEQLRYRAYTLGKAIVTTSSSLQRLADARLYVLIDGRSSEAEFERLANSLVEAGVHVLQLRDKRLADRELAARARLLRRLTRNSSTICIINDRPDIALLSDADGVHVGQEELSVKEARTIVGPGKLVGVSTHSIEQARQAVLDGADYLGCGPTFPSQTKSFENYPGPAFLRQVAEEISLPAFAIGGIDLDRVALVHQAGFRRIAVSQSIVESEEPGHEAKAFLSVISQW